MHFMKICIITATPLNAIRIKRLAFSEGRHYNTNDRRISGGAPEDSSDRMIAREPVLQAEREPEASTVVWDRSRRFTAVGGACLFVKTFRK